MNSHSSFRFFSLSLLGLILWGLLGGLGGCSGGGDIEQEDRPSGLTGPVQLASIYPSGGPVGTIISLCAQGDVSSAIFQFCDVPITIPAAQATLQSDLEDDSSYSGCDEQTTEIIFTVPEGCPVGDVTIQAIAGTDQSNEILFTLTETPEGQGGNGDRGRASGGGGSGGSGSSGGSGGSGGSSGGGSGGSGGGSGGGSSGSGSTGGGSGGAGGGGSGGSGGSGPTIDDDDPVDNDIDCPDEETCEFPTPVCDTTTGDCVACLADTDCHGGPEYSGPSFQCINHQCIPHQCDTDDHCRATLEENPELQSGDTIFQCGEWGCACNIDAHLCENNLRTPGIPEVWVVANETGVTGAGVEEVPAEVTTAFPTQPADDKLKIGAIYLRGDRMVQAYVYGHIYVDGQEVSGHCVRPEDFRSQEEYERWCGDGLVLNLSGVDHPVMGVPHLYSATPNPGYNAPTAERAHHPSVRYPSPYQLLELSNDNFVECDPDAPEADPDYCHEVEENFPEIDDLADLEADWTDPNHLRHRIFKYTFPIGEGVETDGMTSEGAATFEHHRLLFEMFRQDQRFVVVAHTERQPGRGEVRYVIPSGDSEVNFQVPTPRFETAEENDEIVGACSLEPEKDSPYLKVDFRFKNATNATVTVHTTGHNRMRAFFVDDRGNKLLVNTVEEPAPGGGTTGRWLPPAESDFRFVPQIGTDFYVQCVAEGIGGTTVTKEFNVKIEPEAGRTLEDSIRWNFFPRNCDATASDHYEGVVFAEQELDADRIPAIFEDPEEDNDIGRCDIDLYWSFSQRVKIQEVRRVTRTVTLRFDWDGDGVAEESESYNTQITDFEPRSGVAPIYKRTAWGAEKIELMADPDMEGEDCSDDEGHELTDAQFNEAIGPEPASCWPRPANDTPRDYFRCLGSHGYWGQARDLRRRQKSLFAPIDISSRISGGILVRPPTPVFGPTSPIRAVAGNILRGRHLRDRNYETCNTYVGKVRSLGMRRANPTSYHRLISAQKYASLDYISDFRIADFDKILMTSDMGELANDPPDSPWIVRIPVQYQHINTETIHTEMVCWGRVMDECWFPMRTFPSGCYPQYPREGWFNSTPSQAMYYGYLSNYFDDSRRLYLGEAWGTGQFPEATKANFPPDEADPTHEYGEIDHDQDVVASVRPYIRIETKFRVCYAKITAEGYDGRPYTKTVRIPSFEEQESALSGIPDYPNHDMDGIYFTPGDGRIDDCSDGEDPTCGVGYGVDGRYHGAGCREDADCLYNCQELNGALPCTECASDGVCEARFEWNSGPSYRPPASRFKQGSSDCLDGACLDPVKGGTDEGAKGGTKKGKKSKKKRSK